MTKRTDDLFPSHPGDRIYDVRGTKTSSLGDLDAILDGATYKKVLGVVAGVTGVIGGGTGIASYSAGDILYAASASALAKATPTAAKQYLRFGGSVPAWQLIPGSEVYLDKIGAATYQTVQDMHNVMHSAGWISGGTISAAAGATKLGEALFTAADGTSLVGYASGLGFGTFTGISGFIAIYSNACRPTWGSVRDNFSGTDITPTADSTGVSYSFLATKPAYAATGAAIGIMPLRDTNSYEYNARGFEVKIVATAVNQVTYYIRSALGSSTWRNPVESITSLTNAAWTDGTTKRVIVWLRKVGTTLYVTLSTENSDGSGHVDLGTWTWTGTNPYEFYWGTGYRRASVLGTNSGGDLWSLDTLQAYDGQYAGEGTPPGINVTAGTGRIRTAASHVDTLDLFDWSAVTGLTAPTASAYKYVGVEYNAGSPQVVARDTENWNYTTDFPLGYVYNNAGTLVVTNKPHGSTVPGAARFESNVNVLGLLNSTGLVTASGGLTVVGALTLGMGVLSDGAGLIGSVLWNLDGTSWTQLQPPASGTYFLKSVDRTLSWTAQVGDADTLDGQHGAYYLSRANHTGTQAVTTLVAGPAGTVLKTVGTTPTWSALTAADIGSGTFQTGNFVMNGGLTAQALTLTNGSTVISMENATVMSAKNSTGTPESFLWPRWTDNKMYLNFGSAGWQIRTSLSGVVQIWDGSGNVTHAANFNITGSSFTLKMGTFSDAAGLIGSVVWNIDGSSWTQLQPPATGDYFLRSSSRTLSWVSTVGDADTLDGQHGTYYLALANATGTLAVSNIFAGPDGTVLKTTGTTVNWGTLTAADIGPGSFQTGGGFTFGSQVSIAYTDARLLLQGTGTSRAYIELKTDTVDTSARPRLQVTNNSQFYLVGDDHSAQTFLFQSAYAGTRTYQATVYIAGPGTSYGSPRLELYHDGTNGWVKSDVGSLYLNAPAGSNTRLAINGATVVSVSSGSVSVTGNLNATSLGSGTHLGVMTTTGDMIYSIDGSTTNRLPVGTIGQILMSTGTVPAWVDHTIVAHSFDSHTGNLTVTNIAAGADGTFLKTTGTTVNWGGIAANQVDAGIFQSAAYTFPAGLTLTYASATIWTQSAYIYSYVRQYLGMDASALNEPFFMLPTNHGASYSGFDAASGGVVDLSLYGYTPADLLLFKIPTTLEYYAAGWVPWTGADISNLFDGSPYTSVNIDVTHQQFRFVIPVATWGAGSVVHIYQEYTANSPKPLTVQVEYSADGSTGWTNMGTSATITSYHAFFRAASYAGNGYLRLTFNITNDANLCNLRQIRLLTWRTAAAGDYGSDNPFQQGWTPSAGTPSVRYGFKPITGMSAYYLHLGPGFTAPILDEGTGGALNIRTDGGYYVTIGPQNVDYCHFNTDRPDFHFTKPIGIYGATVSQLYGYSVALALGYGSKGSTMTTVLTLNSSGATFANAVSISTGTFTVAGGYLRTTATDMRLQVGATPATILHLGATNSYYYGTNFSPSASGKNLGTTIYRWNLIAQHAHSVMQSVTVASGDTTKTIDFSTGNVQKVTMSNTASCALTLSGTQGGGCYTLMLLASGAGRSFTWATGVEWFTTAPSSPLGIDQMLMLTFIDGGGTNLYGFASQPTTVTS